jgi:Initiator Replication protein
VYDEFKYLKRDVIIKPVEEINRISDIQLVPEFQKQGRKVTAVRFLLSENPQQTLLKPVIQNDHEVIRETEIFKRLLEHGIGERLAILWILQDEERAQKVVEYVEAKARNKKVKGSTAGYICTLYESDVVVGKTPFEEKKEREDQGRIEEEQRKALENRRSELEAEFVRERTTEAVNALSLDDKRAWVQSYIDEIGKEKVKTYNAEMAELRDSLERIQFLAWLRKRLAPEKIESAEYEAWLKAKRHVRIPAQSCH